MRWRYTTHWLLLPPETREVQFDEKWAFVYKKEAKCTPEEKEQGDKWDHTAIDAEHRLLLSVVPGKRTADQCRKVVEDVKKRTGGRTDLLLTSDEHSSYKTAIRSVYAIEERQRKRRQNKRTKRSMPEGLCYATVCKTRHAGRMVSVLKTLVFGTLAFLAALIFRSIVSATVNTSFVERHNATDRGQNARKGRKTLRFSKDWQVHNAMTFFVAYSYNYCWTVRTLRVKNEQGQWQARTPAMSAGLTKHVCLPRNGFCFLPDRLGQRDIPLKMAACCLRVVMAETMIKANATAPG